MPATMVDGSWQQKEPHRLEERGRHKPARKLTMAGAACGVSREADSLINNK